MLSEKKCPSRVSVKWRTTSPEPRAVSLIYLVAEGTVCKGDSPATHQTPSSVHSLYHPTPYHRALRIDTALLGSQPSLVRASQSCLAL